MKLLAHALIASVLVLGGVSASAKSLPKCDRQLLSRHGNTVSLSIAKLTQRLNARLKTAHSEFSNLQLRDEGDNKLQISGVKGGNRVTISGPVTVTSDGLVQIHADKIQRDGSGMKTMMDLFGKSLDDYVNLHHAKGISVNGNDLRISPRTLLELDGSARNVQLKGKTVQILFASQPCR